jgi:3-hydroxybutyryl-CoA dehydratase
LEWNEWQFIAPVYIGDRILAKITIKDLRVTSNSARGVVRLMFEVINQNDEVVQKGCNHLLVQR